MDQSRGSAASSNLLSAPLHFLCWTGRCELQRPSHHAKFKPRRRERSELWKPVSNPFAIEGESGKKTTKPFFSFFVSRLVRSRGFLVPPYAPRHYTNCGWPNSFQNAVVMMLIRLLRLRHPRSSEYAHWSSSLDVPGRSVVNRCFVGRWLISNTPLTRSNK